MGDLALTYDNTTGLMDLRLEEDDLAQDEGLETAVLVALFLDRRANDDDVLPLAEAEDRRGSWADQFPLVEADKIGSRLWQLARAPLIASTGHDAEEFSREALQWMIDDDVARDIEITAETDGQRLTLSLVINRPNGDAVSFAFGHVWDGVAASAV